MMQVVGLTAAGREEATEPREQELVITRVFDAPRTLVFKAWTERERIVHWFGPKGFSTSLFEGDLRPGGAWRARMRSPQGKEYPQHGIVREVVEPERFVFTVTWDAERDHEMLVTMMLAERAGKTGMAFRQGLFDSIEARENQREGWTESFDRLDDYLADQFVKAAQLR